MRCFIMCLLCLSIYSCRSRHPKKEVKHDETRLSILKEAYIFGYPLVTIEMNRRVFTNVTHPNEFGYAPLNQFGHKAIFPNPMNRESERPNIDMFYSSAFIDLKDGPIILTVPSAGKRFYIIQVMDGWSDIVGTASPRVNKGEGTTYFIHNSDWEGEVPPSMVEITSSTNLNWLIARTQIKGPKDLPQVLKFMKSYKLTHFNHLKRNYREEVSKIDVNYSNKIPEDLITKLSGEEYFNILNTLLVNNPPHKEDRPIIQKIAPFGIGADQIFDVDNYSPNEQKYLSELGKKVKDDLLVLGRENKHLNGWEMRADPSIGRFGTNYLNRAKISLVGLGTNLMEDAIYPEAVTDGDGEPFSGQRKYILHFNKGQYPPARAFWSFTIYGSDNYIVPNVFKRYSLSSLDNLRFNSDGSLDLYIQNEIPGGKKNSNWLPTSRGFFTIQARIYWPENSALNGDWTLPAIQKNPESQNSNTAKK
jgi:hypothetical protein